MSRRARLEKTVSDLRERIESAPKDTPKQLRNLWEEELVSLEFDLNNMVDGDEDNNLD